MAPTRSSGDGTKKRRGRPPGSRKSGATVDRVAKLVAAAKKSRKNKTGKKTRGEDDEDELSTLVPSQPQPQPQPRTTQARKRMEPPDVDEITAKPTKVKRKYIQLESRTKRIPQDVVETWPHLPQHVLEQISAVVKDAKKDIANRQRDERKVMAAHNTLNPLVKRLVRHISASKIPPQARDIHFNIDKLTEQIGHVFRDVTTARHSKQLLSKQVRVAQDLLSLDEKNLSELKKDAREWKAEWKHQERHGQIHPLLKDIDDVYANSDGPDDVRLKPSAAVNTYGTSALDAPGAELAPILEQLRRSLENMQGNHMQVEGVDGAMTDAQTALDDVLFRHGSSQQYGAL